jgi:hypothetical protein
MMMSLTAIFTLKIHNSSFRALYFCNKIEWCVVWCYNNGSRVPLLKLPLMVLFIKIRRGSLVENKYTLKAEDKVKGSGFYIQLIGTVYTYRELVEIYG